MGLLRRALLLALAAAGLAGATVEAQSPAQASLDALVTPLYRHLATLKGLSASSPPPPIVIQSRAETRRFIEQELDRRYSSARIEAERKAMVAWRLIPHDYDLRKLFVDMMEEQIAAYYDPRGKVMVVGDWLTPEQQQAALLHELVHALQDRQVSLDAFLHPVAGRGDQQLARQALIEGEAVAVMMDVILRAQGRDFAALPDMSGVQQMIVAGSTGNAIAQAPKFLRDLLLFSYVEGVNFVHQYRKRHPWRDIADLYRDPPRSTTQILHPQKRLGTREDPIPITLPDLGASLPADRLVAEDEMGEFALGQVLGLHLGEAEGRRAAVGWRGDRYRIWEDGPGRFVIAYLIAVQSERVANALALRLTGLLEWRHPALAGKGVQGMGALLIWRENGRSFAIEKRGAEVLLLEQIPERGLAVVREAIWRSRPSAVAPRP